MKKFNQNKIGVLLLILASSILNIHPAFATGGLSCKSSKGKLRFDVVESSEQTPVSAKLFYKTDAIEGEDGSVQSLDLKNSTNEKPIIYTQENNSLVVIIFSGSSVVSAKLNLLNMKGKAQAMISDEARTLNINCIRE